MKNLINSVSSRATDSVIDTLTPNTNISRALVVIDAGVDDYEFLINGVLADADVILLDRHRDGIAQIGEVLRSGDLEHCKSLLMAVRGSYV